MSALNETRPSGSVADAQPPPQHAAWPAGSRFRCPPLSRARHLPSHRFIDQYRLRRGSCPYRPKLDRPLRRISQRHPAPGLRHYRLPLPALDRRTRLELDTLALRRLGDSALDGHRAGCHLRARRVRPLPVALALAARCPGRRRNGARDRRNARGVPQHAGCVAGGICAGRRRPLLCLRHQLLDAQDTNRRSLAQPSRLARPLQQLARRACRTQARHGRAHCRTDPARSRAAAFLRSHRRRARTGRRDASTATEPSCRSLRHEEARPRARSCG